jgi:hypothetical protein
MLDVELKGRTFVVENEKQKLEISFDVRGDPVCFLYTDQRMTVPIGFCKRSCRRIPSGWNEHIIRVDPLDYAARLRGYMRIVAGGS